MNVAAVLEATADVLAEKQAVSVDLETLECWLDCYHRLLFSSMCFHLLRNDFAPCERPETAEWVRKLHQD